MFSRKSNTVDNRDFASAIIASAYDERMQKTGFIMSETFQDHMQSLHDFMKMVLGKDVDVGSLVENMNPYIENIILPNCI